MAIYSTSLFIGQLDTTRTLIYSPPADNTVVIRDMELVNDANSMTVFIAINTASGFNGNFWIPTFSSSSWSSMQWEGRVVLPAGSGVYGSCTAGTAALTMSGYVLT